MDRPGIAVSTTVHGQCSDSSNLRALFLVLIIVVRHSGIYLELSQGSKFPTRRDPVIIVQSRSVLPFALCELNCCKPDWFCILASVCIIRVSTLHYSVCSRWEGWIAKFLNWILIVGQARRKQGWRMCEQVDCTAYMLISQSASQVSEHSKERFNWMIHDSSSFLPDPETITKLNFACFSIISIDWTDLLGNNSHKHTHTLLTLFCCLEKSVSPSWARASWEQGKAIESNHHQFHFGS